MTLPWSSWDEYLRVYHSILSGKYDECAVPLRAWLCRCRCPIFVECSYHLLSVSDSIFDTCESHVKLLAGAACVVRCVNLMSDAQQESMIMLSVAAGASQLGVPQWVVQLRHKIAHGTDLPSIGLIAEAVSVLLNLCVRSFWTPLARYAVDCVAHESSDTRTAIGLTDTEAEYLFEYKNSTYEPDVVMQALIARRCTSSEASGDTSCSIINRLPATDSRGFESGQCSDAPI